MLHKSTIKIILLTTLLISIFNIAFDKIKLNEILINNLMLENRKAILGVWKLEDQNDYYFTYEFFADGTLIVNEYALYESSVPELVEINLAQYVWVSDDKIEIFIFNDNDEFEIMISMPDDNTLIIQSGNETSELKKLEINHQHRSSKLVDKIILGSWHWQQDFGYQDAEFVFFDDGTYIFWMKEKGYPAEVEISDYEITSSSTIQLTFFGELLELNYRVPSDNRIILFKYEYDGDGIFYILIDLHKYQY